jgi:hypothetical protein
MHSAGDATFFSPIQKKPISHNSRELLALQQSIELEFGVQLLFLYCLF